MKIYTRKGDGGETGLFGGTRVPKNHLRLDAYGTVDELNSILGMIVSGASRTDLKEALSAVQATLFVVGADLATPSDHSGGAVRRIRPDEAEPLERMIDDIEAGLDPLKTFIIPGGSETAAKLQFARTVCRRAERSVVALARKEEISGGVIVYLNRLSDLLFVLARRENKRDGEKETPWKG